jgi:hypothetical protein
MVWERPREAWEVAMSKPPPLVAAGLLVVLMGSGTGFAADSSEWLAGAKIRITPVAGAEASGFVTLGASRIEAPAGAAKETGDFLTVKRDQQVVHIPKKTIVGKLVATDAEFLTVMRGTEQLTIPRAAVQRLQMSRGRSRLGPALVGLVVGAAVGGILASQIQTRRPPCENGLECAFFEVGGELTDASARAAAIMGGGVAGALCGALIGKERWEPVQLDNVLVSLAPVPRGAGVLVAVRF